MVKWKLLVTPLPFPLGVLMLNVILDRGLGFEGIIDFSDLGAILTAGAFLIGFMLSGVMADYKESERLPGEIAASSAGCMARSTMPEYSRNCMNSRVGPRRLRLPAAVASVRACSGK